MSISSGDHFDRLVPIYPHRSFVLSPPCFLRGPVAYPPSLGIRSTSHTSLLLCLIVYFCFCSFFLIRFHVYSLFFFFFGFCFRFQELVRKEFRCRNRGCCFVFLLSSACKGEAVLFGSFGHLRSREGSVATLALSCLSLFLVFFFFFCFLFFIIILLLCRHGPLCDILFLPYPSLQFHNSPRPSPLLPFLPYPPSLSFRLSFVVFRSFVWTWMSFLFPVSRMKESTLLALIPILQANDVHKIVGKGGPAGGGDSQDHEGGR